MRILRKPRNHDARHAPAAQGQRLETAAERQSGVPGARIGANPVRAWDSLPVRLAVTVNLAAFAVLGAFWWIDYQRTQATLLSAETRKLREEAKVLVVGQRHSAYEAEFQRFVDHFCEQMDTAASPGHHIAVFDAEGETVVRAHVRGDPEIEAAMGEHRSADTAMFVFGGAQFLVASVDGSGGTRVVVAQSLSPLRAVMRAQAVSRAWSIGTLGIAILAVSTVSVIVWVHRPLRRLVRALRAVGRGDFSARVRPAGSREVRYLATGLNEMAAELERVDRGRKSQMKRAREIQRRLLPRDGRHVGDYEIAAAFEPAESVGGDFYDIVELANGSALVVVLDVCGHGVPAALHTALLRTILRYEANAETDPAAIAGAMNRQFLGVTDSGEFATCFLMRLSPGGRIDFASAGHDPALILRGDGSMTLLDSGGPVLGVVEDQVYETGSAELHPDDELFLFTDGLYEIIQADGTLLGRDRWIDLLRGLSLEKGGGNLHEVVERARQRCPSGRFEDDVTLVRVRRLKTLAAGEETSTLNHPIEWQPKDGGTVVERRHTDGKAPPDRSESSDAKGPACTAG
ncbi:MAG: SpoIIE family protein phosphatase [Phycisphaerae bacterium]|nr:SpoIIE family protein phosphatase [Phycisphaerae bacterium]MCZ2399251.1 SpoIIE family protein phosphatase [Phycisphaerae bacterium]